MRRLARSGQGGVRLHPYGLPAGLGEKGFRLAVCGADRGVVVSTTDTSALRDAAAGGGAALPSACPHPIW